MTNWKCISALFVVYVCGILTGAAGISVVNDPVAHTVTMADAQRNLCIRLNYNGHCYLDRVLVRGREVVSADTGVYSAIKVSGQWTGSRDMITTPVVQVRGHEVVVDGILYTGGGITVREQWRFVVSDEQIDWQIRREYLNSGVIDDTCFPGWDFKAMDTWTGGLLDSGGVAWGRYLSSGSSYGAHVGRVTFFKPSAGPCLRITPSVSPGIQLASRFSHQPGDQFSFVESATVQVLAPKYGLHRFNHSLDIWGPFHVEPATVEVNLSIKVLADEVVQNRGSFKGLDGNAIRDLLDTIGRYGVIDRRIMGGNGWLSGFVCLHEPFFAEMGLAIDDPDFIGNLTETLDEWRDHAQRPDGRILSRWCHDQAGDNMVPGTYDPKTGFYECGWGYTLDSQPDYVINTAEQFDLNGDITWLRARKESCERALDWLLARDADGDGLVEMMNDSHHQEKSSDWIDVVWASHKNALVNAAMYEAMMLWAAREAILGDEARSAYYRVAATKLRETFCRPVSQGGFWNPDRGWFVYWRDRDDSIHGDNLVTPVNFCAVAYGLADGEQRKQILDGIEERMRQEKLFRWPLCFLPYQADEGAAKSFPEYENGDIFLSWGEVGVRAYSDYNPAIAVSYVQRVLEQYQRDGLSFQRYLRRDQQGAGNDILSGNCMTIVGLYRDIYGVRPMWNRLCLEPHLTPELEGTKLNYELRGQRYQLTLGMNQSEISTAGFTVRSAGSFAVNVTANRLTCYPGEQNKPALAITRDQAEDMVVMIEVWPEAGSGICRWTASFRDQPMTLQIEIFGLQPHSAYQLQVDGENKFALHSDSNGAIVFNYAESHAKAGAFALIPKNAANP